MESIARLLSRSALIVDLRWFFISANLEKLRSQLATLTATVKKIRSMITMFGSEAASIHHKDSPKCRPLRSIREAPPGAVRPSAPPVCTLLGTVHGRGVFIPDNRHRARLKCAFLGQFFDLILEQSCLHDQG